MPQQIARVRLFYDSLGRVIEDSQEFDGNTRNSTSEAFVSHPVTQMAFPDGRQTTNEYDSLYRRTLVRETGGADIAAWHFFGPSRVAEVTMGNGLICSHLNNTRTRSAIQTGQGTPGWGDDSSDRLGYDGAGRMITKRYLAGGIDGGTGAYNDPTTVVGQTTAYDKASNKLYERSLQAESRSSLYEPFDADNRPEGGYDSIDRLRQYQRGVLSSTGGSGNAGGGSVTTPISLPGTDKSRDYDLDGLGNWRRTGYDPNLIGHWPLNDGAGSIARDTSGFANNGSLIGDPQWQKAANHFGGIALDFNGLNDYVEMGDIELLKMRTYDLTLSIWIKPDTDSGAKGLIHQGNPFNLDGSGYRILYRDQSGIPSIQPTLNNGSGNPWSMNGFTQALSGEWHHVAVVIQNPGDLIIYRDGEELLSTPNQKSGDVQGTRPFTLGALPFGATGFFDGQLSDARVYRRSLSSAQIRALATMSPDDAQIIEIRQHNSLNQITRLETGGEKTRLTYDKNGNLLNDGTRTYEWDALNRLKKVYKTPSSPVVIGEYTYDALGRRIRKVVTGGGLSGNIPNGTTDFLYHSGISQCCEERDGSDDPFKQYVWGIYIDELLQMKTFATINGNTAGDYYPLSDTLYRTMALTDDVGGLVEAYDTDAYGNTLIFTAAGTGNDWWADDAVHGDNPTCAFIFTGRRYDPETGNYFYRARYDGVELGRFLSRDTAGYYGSGLNLYAYVHNAPTGLSDPSGRLIHRPLEGSGYGSGASNQLVIVGTTQTGATPADVLLAYGALALALIAGTVMVEAPEPIDLPDWEWQPRTRDCPRGQPRTTGPTIGPVPRQGQEQNCRDRHPSWDACPQNNILWPASVANSFLRVSCPNNPRLVITDCTPISNIAPACGHSGGVQYHCFVSEGMINPLPIVYRVSVRCCNCCSRGRQSIESRDCGNAHWSQGNRPPQCY